MPNIVPVTKFWGTASKRYPNVVWTGWSEIHVSKFAAKGYEHEPGTRLLAEVVKSKYAESLWSGLNKLFVSMEWLMDHQQFKDLLLVDLNRLINGDTTSRSLNRFKNPATGNWFHHIGIDESYIGGIRFWVEEGRTGGTWVCARFRIEHIKENQDIVRTRAVGLNEEVKGEVKEVYESIMEFNEPPKGEQVTIKVFD